MITKEEVLAKLDQFKAYSIEQEPSNEESYTELMAPLYEAVNTYFSTTPSGMIEALENYVHQTYCDISVRSIKYETPIEVNYPTDYPEGYNDIRTCFYTFPLMETTQEDFFNAWVEGTPTEPTAVEPPPSTPSIVSNSLIDQWLPEIQSAPTNDVARVKSVNEWCANTAGTGNMINLLEDQGRILDSKGTQEIAQIIYIDHHLLEVIRTKGFQVYVPSYIK